ncbi:RDD family protein [Streptacidiphilus jeojiense]|uniref:RDD family protein n=1 Tax=Streptacidiphilus cavernicola TaxID=3342716 RepID=A0ABV6URD5_9ACTN|nr:RDD family protein [Streptacidiphilus jeojiense]
MQRAVSRWRRGLAWLVDFCLAVGLAALLASLTFHRISVLVTDVPSLAGAVGTGSWQVLSSHGHTLTAATGSGLELWHDVERDVQEAFLALALGFFLYQFLMTALAGRTLGMALLGLRVSRRDGERLRRGQSARRAAVATTADLGLYSIACCLLVSGDFTFSLVCWGVAVVAFWCNALPVLTPSGRSLADRFSGAVVGSSLRLPAAAVQHVQAVQAAAVGTRAAVANAPQAVAEAEATRRALELKRATADGGRRAWDGMRQGVEAGAQRFAVQERLRRPGRPSWAVPPQPQPRRAAPPSAAPAPA